MAIPKYLTSHPAVSEVEYMLEQSGGAYRWGVYLKPGWIFENSRNAGGRSLNINNKADFVWANPVREPEPTTIDCTPSPAAMLRMLLTIIEGSSDDESRDYARSEIERCYPDPVTCVQDTRYEPVRVFSGTKDQCSAYAKGVVVENGAGFCDIYELENYAHAMDFFDMIFIPTLESK